MKKNFYLIILLFGLTTLIGCFQFRKGDQLTQFKSFQFSFQAPSNSKYFSVLFSQSDTFFLKKYSLSNKDTLFYSILPDSGRSVINNFVININPSFFHPLKADSNFNPVKGISSIYIDYSDENQYLNFDGLPTPKVFRKFNNWVNEIIENSTFKIADTSLEFKEDKKIHQVMIK